MKKNTFLTGAFVTTLGIVLTKLLGVFYVIPFHALIGEEGGALYGYAYTIYSIFTSLATAGIPLAISKIVSEYQTLGYYNTKKRVFVLGKKISLLLGFISFLLILIFAPVLARAILGDVVGGNSVEDVTFVLRVIGTAILIVPTLSIYRGYFEGHRFMNPPSISQVLEQIVRVSIIIFGSLLSVKVFHLNLRTVVGISLFAASVGAFVAYLYLVDKKIKNKAKFNERIRPVNEPIVTDKIIIQKIIVYAIPFIAIDIFKSLYNYVDMVTVVKGLVHVAKYSAIDAESVYAMLSTWANKFNMVVVAISSGVIVSLIPNLTESIIKDDKVDIEKKIVKAYSVLLYITIPLTLGISFLAKPIWLLFYGESIYGPSVLSYSVFSGFMLGLFTLSIVIIQTLKDYKFVFISLGIGLFFKILLNYNLMAAFYQMGNPPYYGVITATIIGYLISFIICSILLHFKYHIRFEEVVKNFIDIMCGSLLMILILFLFKFIVPFESSIWIGNFAIILFYGIMGMVLYFVYAYFTGLSKKIFGNEIVKTIKKIIMRK